MSIASGQLLLLDTNVVVHLARNDQTGQYLEQTYGLTSRPDRPAISTVTEGEVLGLAIFRRWSQQKLTALRGLLAQFVRIDAGLPQVVEAFAELYCEMRKTGNTTNQNDLWIAATARATKAMLLTNDTDFNWMHPSLVTVCYVAPKP